MHYSTQKKNIPENLHMNFARTVLESAISLNEFDVLSNRI